MFPILPISVKSLVFKGAIFGNFVIFWRVFTNIDTIFFRSHWNASVVVTACQILNGNL